MKEVSYAFGLSVAANLRNSGIKDIDADAFLKGVVDVMKGNALEMSAEKANTLINQYFAGLQAESNKQAEINKQEEAAFLAKNKEKAGVFVTESGLQYEIVSRIGDNGCISKHKHGLGAVGHINNHGIHLSQQCLWQQHP